MNTMKKTLSPSSKAAELVLDFADKTGKDLGDWNVSIECAIYTVDQIIQENNSRQFQDMLVRLEYWGDVRRELILMMQ